MVLCSVKCGFFFLKKIEHIFESFGIIILLKKINIFLYCRPSKTQH